MKPADAQMDRAQRKRQLIAQGALHRTGLVLARQETRAALQPQTLARGALAQAAGLALSMLGPRAAGLLPGAQAWLPLALSVLPALGRRRRLWPVAAVGAAAAALGLWLARRRNPGGERA